MSGFRDGQERSSTSLPSLLLQITVWVCSSSPSPHWFEHWPLCQFPVSHSNVLRGANRQNRQTRRLTPGEGKDGARRGREGSGTHQPRVESQMRRSLLSGFRSRHSLSGTAVPSERVQVTGRVLS